jgi:Cu/Ag efflux pump CusA
VVARILRRAARYLILYAAIAGVVALIYTRLPTSFLPQEDQGYMLVNVQLPPGATLERTQKRDGAGRRLGAEAARSAEHGRRAGLLVLGPGPERRRWPSSR